MTPASPSLGRRAILAASVATLLASRNRQAGAAEATLRGAAAAAGLRYGASSDIDIARAPPEYRAMFARQCSLIAPYSSWQVESPARGELTLTGLNGTLTFSEANHLKLTGLHIYWYRRLPAWLEPLDAAQRGREAVAHAGAVVRALQGKVFSWNVLNEEFRTKDGLAGGYRRNGLFDRAGAGVVADMFQAAHEADPAALLALNDSGTEQEYGGAAALRVAMLGALDELKRRNAPIQAIGMESHLRADLTFDAEAYRRFLGEVAARGVRILVTELDVQDRTLPGEPAERDRLVAGLYKRYLDVVLDEKATASVVTWGLSDRYSWLNSGYDPSFKRPDGLPQRPLPFDDLMRPKPVFDALLQAFRSCPRRPPA